MTQVQKGILIALFDGGNIAPFNGKYRLRDNKFNPIRNFNFNTFFRIRKLMRKDKNGYMVLDKNKVRQQSGHTWVKKYYNETQIKSTI